MIPKEKLRIRKLIQSFLFYACADELFPFMDAMI